MDFLHFSPGCAFTTVFIYKTFVSLFQYSYGVDDDVKNIYLGSRGPSLFISE